MWMSPDNDMIVLIHLPNILANILMVTLAIKDVVDISITLLIYGL